MLYWGGSTCSTLHVSSSSSSFSHEGCPGGGHFGHAHSIVFSQLEKPYPSLPFSCRSMGGGEGALWARAHPSHTMDLPLPLSHTSLTSSLTRPPPLPMQADLGIPLQGGREGKCACGRRKKCIKNFKWPIKWPQRRCAC